MGNTGGKLNVGSLFSGIGGIDLGFEREGFKTRWFVEIEPYCQAVLRRHWPGIPIYGDIRELDFASLEPVDILVGGFPCQDISQAGKGEGITGKRSSLWKEYAKAIRILRPKIAVIENVPILSDRGLNVVLADLAKIGYDAEWFCIFAADVGAPYKRRRMFIIAYPCQQRQIHEQVQEQPGKGRQQAQLEVAPSFVTDDFKRRIQRYCEESLSGEQGFSWCKDVRRVEDFGGRPDIPEPLFRGSSDGVPHWVDRIAGCGNAVLPQVAQFIARQIKKEEKWLIQS